MNIGPNIRVAAAGLAACILMPAASHAHPHIFAEARLEVKIEQGAFTALRHVWRFDDLFSSTVLFEFDQNRDNLLDAGELELVASVIHESLAEFGYFQFVTADGRDIEMQAPERMIASFEDQQLMVLFESRPPAPMDLDGDFHFGVYDPTFYTAIDFYDDANLVTGQLPDGCARKVVRPDPDEALAMNQESLTDAFFNEPGGIDYSKLFATRLEISCPDKGAQG